jgi:hypothetical protein
MAARNISILHGEPNPRLRHFLVGRQLFAAVCYVLLARSTSFSGSDGNVSGGFWGWNRWACAVFLQTGLLGSILVTNVGVLAWRMAASCFPASFMNSWISNGLIRTILATEATGIIAAAWVLAGALDQATRRKPAHSDMDVG